MKGLSDSETLGADSEGLEAKLKAAVAERPPKAERIAAACTCVVFGSAMPEAWLSVSKLPLAVGFAVGRISAELDDCSAAEIFEVAYELIVAACVAADSTRGLSPEEIRDAVNFGVAAFAEPEGSA